MRHRGHVIVKSVKSDDDATIVWTKIYLAYNAHPEWTLPVLQTYPIDAVEQVKNCTKGISQFDLDKSTNWGRVVGAYHDHRDYDTNKHPNTDYATLEEALASCVWENVYVWDGENWSHHVISAEVKKEAFKRPPKRNVWREMRKLTESKQASVEPTVETPQEPVEE